MTTLCTCLCFFVEAKNGVAELKKHPWFEDLEWTSLETQDAPAPWIPPTESFEKTPVITIQEKKPPSKNIMARLSTCLRTFNNYPSHFSLRPPPHKKVPLVL
eukprot:UN13251